MRVTAMLLARNEADRYLPAVLMQLRLAADRIVVLDDASTDATAELCREAGAEVTTCEAPGFANEVALRRRLWGLAVATEPDWILCLDADETFEPGGPEILRDLLHRVEEAGADGLAVPLYDMWSPTHYRDDALWSAHRRDWTVCVRYRADREYLWREQPQHCGRLPVNASLRTAAADLRLQHWGWSRPADREAKAARYRALDPDARWGSVAQYASILDPAPHLVPWEARP